MSFWRISLATVFKQQAKPRAISSLWMRGLPLRRLNSRWMARISARIASRRRSCSLLGRLSQA
jgi:hypothetical protein